MLHKLGSTWIFGNGTGMLPNISQGDLFEEFPRRWKSCIHPVGQNVHINAEDHKSFCEALYQLQNSRMKLMSDKLSTVSYFILLIFTPSKVFPQVDRFISKVLNGWTCNRLVDLVVTEESRTVYLVGN